MGLPEVMEDEVILPADASVIGEAVTVSSIDYENERRGLTARCRREDGSAYMVAACDLVFQESSKAADYIAAYRTWLGIDPYPQLPIRKRPKAKEDELVVGKKLEFVVLVVKANTVSCRILWNGPCSSRCGPRALRGGAGRDHYRDADRIWRYAGHPYPPGRSRGWRLDIPALGLTPLGLKEMGMWDPKDTIGENLTSRPEPWARPIIKRGRAEYEMERCSRKKSRQPRH